MKKTTFLKTLLVAVALCAGSSTAWAQITTWDFTNSLWTDEAIVLSGGNQYDADGGSVVSGGVAFNGTSFVKAATSTNGIGFTSTGSTTGDHISLVIPKGFKVAVTVYSSSNRNVKAEFNGSSQTFNAGWAESTKEFDNSEGASDVTLYLYCSANAGGATQAPYLRKIVLTDLSAVASHPWTANAVATINDTKTIIKTYSSTKDIVEGSQYNVVVEKVIEYNGKYYALNDASFASNVYGLTYTMGSATANYEFTYEEIKDVAFYGEIEDIYTAGSNASKTENNTLLSNGGGYSAVGSSGYVKVTFSVPADGCYNLAIGMNNTNGKDRGFNYAIDKDAVSDTYTVKANKADVYNITSKALTAGEHTLTMNITYSLTPVFDYLLITSVPFTELTPGSNATGFMTFAFGASLDFSATTTKAYIATEVADGKVSLTQVSKVPAGTGLILERASGSTEAIPVYDGSDFDDVSANKLARGTGAAVDAGYVLVNRAGTAEFAGIGTDKPVVAKDQAYLNIAAEAPYLQFVFAGAETTGISTVKAAAANGAIYNLNGQRVAKATKGLYIVNGKKAIIK